MLQDKKILIISPHPDDEAICCGGLIMLAKKEKAAVSVLYMAVGASRQFVTGKTSAQERLPEIKEAADFGNFTYTIAYQGDEFMRLDSLPQKELIEKIEDQVQEFKPDIVCIPPASSFDQDHRAAATAAITALRPLPKTLRHQPTLIFAYEEPYSWTISRPFEPNFYFDISTVFKEKISLLKCHKTQVRNDPFPRSSENLERLAGLRGCEISVKYAEAYHLLKGQPL